MFSSNIKESNLSLFQRVEAALHAMQSGYGVILQDDFDRENEADLIFSAEKMTVADMALMIRSCSGIVCLCLDDDRIRQLCLPPMVSNNESQFGTAFTVSIEARHGVTTGVSAADRLTTIRTAIGEDARPEDLARPGHVFPLRAHPDGVLGRKGHTEGSVDLARMAGLKSASVLCELMSDDGSMMRGQDVDDFASLHNFPTLTIADLIQYRTITGK